jgi:hypothetical protein
MFIPSSHISVNFPTDGPSGKKFPSSLVYLNSFSPHGNLYSVLLKCFTLQLDQPTRPALTKLAPDIAGQCSKLSHLTCFPLLYIKWMQRRAKFLLANQLCRLQLSLDYIFYILRPMFAVIPEVLVSFLSGPTLCYTINLSLSCSVHYDIFWFLFWIVLCIF